MDGARVLLVLRSVSLDAAFVWSHRAQGRRRMVWRVVDELGQAVSMERTCVFDMRLLCGGG